MGSPVVGSADSCRGHLRLRLSGVPTVIERTYSCLDYLQLLRASSVVESSFSYPKYPQLSVIRVLDNHAPIRQSKVRNSYAPYIDRDLKHNMFLRDLYKQRFNKTKNPEDWKLFQTFRNITNVEKRKKKKTFYSDKLNESKNDMTKYLEIIKYGYRNKIKNY